MKKTLLLTPALLLLVSCASTVQMVGENSFKASCHKLRGGCEEQMKKKCPNGYKVNSEGSTYGVWGAENEIYFTCNKG